MDDPNFTWQELYRAALLELEPDRLLEYVDLAERAIRARRALLQADNGNHAAEKMAMDDALHVLGSLRRNGLGKQGRTKARASSRDPMNL